MYQFSSKTFVNKEYKLNDFLKQIKATKEVKGDAQVIDKIFFRNVITASSINAIEDAEYKNIYIIKIVLKEERIPHSFIELLDKNIAFHTYFVFEYNDKISTMIAYKEINTKVQVDRYYSHPFHKEKELQLPIVNSVSDVYKCLLAYEININYKKNEKPNEYINRVKQINKLNFQISKTEKAIIYETQPKKKFEYNERLRKYKKELNNLLSMEE